MLVNFYASNKERELMLAEAMGEGVANAGHTYSIVPPAHYQPSECAIFFGVKGANIITGQQVHGGHSVYLDKGYTRSKGKHGHTEYTRVVVNDRGPGRYMMHTDRPADRLELLGLHMTRRRKVKRGHILYCGSTEKYHAFHGLTDTDQYARSIIETCKINGANHDIIYRPKPGMRVMDRFPYVRISKSTEPLESLFEDCHLLITHGATCAMEAVLAGVPAMCAPACIASPVAGWQREQIIEPFWPDDALRHQWASNAAYCEWTTEEMRSGEAWAYIEQEINRARL